MDYDALAKAGSMLGSGGMVVMDEDTCMVDMARRVMHFYSHESCGWCIPCREGTSWLTKMLDRFHAGYGTQADITNVLELSKNMLGRTFCALGDAAAMPTISIVEKDVYKRQMQATAVQSKTPKVVSQAEWLEARKEYLKKEKEFTRLRDELSRQRRELPWEKIDKNYVFEGPSGRVTLGDLFGGKSQLIIYHFMFGPEWKEGCPSCSMLADHFDGSIPHLKARDVTLLAVSRAPLGKITEFKDRMGWRFPWVSSYGNDFNRDFHVFFTKEEMAAGQMLSLIHI